MHLRTMVAQLAKPWVAGALALVVYLLRACLSPNGLHVTDNAYFNYLADAFLHGQLALRQLPDGHRDLSFYQGQAYLYWPPFPALLVVPLVALFGVGVSDVVYTAVIAAVTVSLLARLLETLDAIGIAPLTVERRAVLVITLAFGSVVLILAPVGTVWFTGQLVGWGCALLAAVAALTGRGRWGYFLTGLALACAMLTRVSLVFNGIWLAYWLLRRDWKQPRYARLVAWGLAPLVAAGLWLAWYNWARFGSPADMGLAYHNVNPFFRADFEHYGVFNPHYLPTNLKFQFVAYSVFDHKQRWFGSGLFWMTPVLLGAFSGIRQGWRDPLVWMLLLSCAVIYIPIGLLMGTGWVTFGPRYLLDLMVPLVVMTARGIRHWRLEVLAVLLIVSCATYLYGSWVWLQLQEDLSATGG